MSPKVSVIMPTFRRGDNGYLRRAMDSVLTQVFNNFEFIIIDDGSRDSTQQIVRSYADPRIRYVRHEDNCGIPAVRVNEGIRLSRGEYLAFMFDDDQWLPYHLESTVNHLNNLGNNYAMVFALTHSINAQDQSVTILGADYSPQRIFEGNCIGNQAVLIRKAAIIDVGGYDEDPRMRRVCDWDLWRRLRSVGYEILRINHVTSINTWFLPDSMMNSVGYDEAFVLQRMNQNRRVYLRSLVSQPFTPAQLRDPSILHQGQLIKSDGPGVYLVLAGYKHLFPNEERFLGLGFSWANIAYVSQEYLNSIPDGAPLF